MALSQADKSTLRFFSMSKQICKEKRKYNNILEHCQRGNCDLTQWLVWYLECMQRSIEDAESTLSAVLDKSTFWQNHHHLNFTERQRSVLNTYLDGYCGKLTIKNWAKLSKTSPDTAARDVRVLEQLGVLIPEKGCARDISYAIRISPIKTKRFCEAEE